MFHRDFIALLKLYQYFSYDFSENKYSRQYNHTYNYCIYSKDFIAKDELSNKITNLVNFGKEKADFIDYYGEWYSNYN